MKKNAPLELYHISEDPNEQHNLADQYPKMVKELDEVMHRMHKPSVNYPIPEDNQKPVTKARKRRK